MGELGMFSKERIEDSIMFWREVTEWEERLGDFIRDSDSLNARVLIQEKSEFWEEDSILKLFLEA